MKMTFMEQLKDRLANISEAADEMDGDLEDALDGSAAQQVSDGAAIEAGRNNAPRPRSSTRLGVSAAPEADEVMDDPLCCSAGAITATMPARLSRLAAADGVDADRVWTTMCCVALLETLNVSYLWTDGEPYPAIERTMVDAGREWVEAQAAETPSLAAALEDGALAKAATRAMTLWHRAWERRVDELRRADAITAHHTASFVHRSGTELMRAVCTKHSTFAVFLSAPLDGMQRWQTFMILVTLVITQLLVNIWMCVRASRLPARAACPRCLTPACACIVNPLRFQVLRTGSQLLRRGASHPGLPSRWPLPRRGRQLRGFVNCVCHDAAARRRLPRWCVMTTATTARMLACTLSRTG
jgi:hypothetical protein